MGMAHGEIWCKTENFPSGIRARLKINFGVATTVGGNIFKLKPDNSFLE